MSLVEKFLLGLRNPTLVMDRINREFASKILSKTRKGAKVFEEDWDFLIILDAARYDCIREYDFGQADVESRISGGSNSIEFIEYNANDRPLDDVVWVTANPWVSNYDDRIYKVVNVWDFGWNEDLNTVLPETIVEATMEAVREYPNKRVVAHFMQPHYPFIGVTGQNQLPKHRSFTGGDKIESNIDVDIWTQLQNGEVDEETVRKAYIENFDEVVPKAKKLAESLPGKAVITADHGNEFGTRSFPFPLPIYGHPAQQRTYGLIEVPWIVYSSDQRRTIKSGEITQEDIDTDVSERLNHLGYIDE
ncbi:MULTISPECIES: hypothetical protein [Haloferax]|uniref:Sulfatase N-terminal domain-containing protein n=1 Tax=Haloferax marinum TaxID=2666143 RepID=A0A6A8G3W5_9EURY|nr:MULTISPECIES: hypothetical protein [Haloferax]KAB1196264.1 hypothetical protein Hfx1150_01525 [Haloferax sp. CBA1150]MRW95252.1 hypothetical protein [Haloferax marinum]